MRTSIWSALLVAAMGVAPAIAQTPAATPAHAGDATRVAPAAQTPDASDDLALFAALDLDDQDLLAADVDRGPLEAPMGDPGPRMGGSRRGPGGMHGNVRGRLGMMAAQLDLSREQREKIRGIFDQQMRRGIQQRADIQIAALDLRQMVRADKPNTGAIDGQVDKLARLRATLAKQRIAALLDARAVLTPEQREKLQQLRMQGWGGRHGGGGHDDDGPGDMGDGDGR